MPPTLITSFPCGAAGQTSYVHVRDMTSGYDLYERNPDTVFDWPASLTKLMTGLLILEAKSGVLTSETVTFTTVDVTQPIVAATVDMAGFQDADVCTWEGVLYAMFLPSGCDACLCAGRVIGTEMFVAAGSTGTTGVVRFVEAMNAKAVTLGMTNSVYTDCFGGGKIGATVRNQASARDVTRVLTAAMAYAALKTITQAPTRSIAVTGINARTLSVTAYNRFQNGPTLNQSGISDTRTRGGKNGTWISDGLTHYNLSQVWESPNGTLVAITTMNATTLLNCSMDQRGMMYMLCRDFPYLLAGAPGTYDVDFASVKVLIGFDGADVDESPVGRTVTNTSVTLAGVGLVATGTAGVFDNLSDKVNVADAADVRIGAGDATTEMWFAGDGSEPAAEYLFVSKLGVSGQKEWCVNFFGGIMQFFLSSDGSNWNVSAGVIYHFGTNPLENATFFNGAPRHLAFVKSGSSWWAYLNGEKMTNTATLASIFDGTNPFGVGFQGSGASFLGSADEFRFTKGVARYSLNMYTIDPQKFGRTATAPSPPASPPAYRVAAAATPTLAVPDRRLQLAPKFVSSFRHTDAPPPPPPASPGSFPQPVRVGVVGLPYTGVPDRLNPLAAKFKSSFTYTNAPPGQDEQAAQAAQFNQPDYNTLARGLPVRGPWNRSLGFVEGKHRPAPPPEPDVPSQHTMFPFRGLGQVGGTVKFTRFLIGKYPGLGYTTPPPVDPTLPPPPPPPGTGKIGSPRRRQMNVPRAPDTVDARVRPHIDKVAGIFNSLIRQGFVRPEGDNEFSISSGAYSLPRPPAVNDDVTAGAQPGNIFINTLTNECFVCVSNAKDAAVWLKLATS